MHFHLKPNSLSKIKAPFCNGICSKKFLGNYCIIHLTKEACYYYFLFCFLATWCSHGPYGILVPQSVFEPFPLKWKCRVLTDRPPGKSQKSVIIDKGDPFISSMIIYSNAREKNRPILVDLQGSSQSVLGKLC